MKKMMIAAFTFLICLSQTMQYAHAGDSSFYNYYIKTNGPLRQFFMKENRSLGALTALLITTTIMQLSRESQAIVDGSIVAGDGGKNKKGNQSRSGVLDTGLKMEVEEVVWGDTSLKGRTIPVRILHSEPPPEAGFRGWIFLTRKPLQSVFDVFKKKMSVDDLDTEETPYWVLAGGKRSCIKGNKEFMKYLESYVETSIGFYRDHTVEPIEMAKMLAEMSDSPYKRLSKDARLDISMLYSVLSSSEQDELLQRKDCPTQIRDVFQKIRHKPNRTRTRSRSAFKSALKEVEFREAMESGDPERIEDALKVLGRFGRHEYNLYKDLWAPYLRPLLKHEKFEVRVSVAGELAELENPDPVAVNVLIEALRYPDARNLVQGSLRRATGKDFPYDPTASEETKEAQIEKWEQWWEEKGRDNP